MSERLKVVGGRSWVGDCLWFITKAGPIAFGSTMGLSTKTFLDGILLALCKVGQY